VDVEIRPFAERDRAQVIALWTEVFAGDPPWNEPSAMIDRKLRVQRELFLVAVAAGEVAGTVLAGFDGVRGWIHHLAVLPAHRRRGAATQLVQAAERGLANLGCPKINLQVRAGNAGAIAFYRALGYQVEDRASLGKRLEG